jgi:hypothetical protein
MFRETETCDLCDKPVDAKTAWFVFKVRPSDPSQLVSVLMTCHEHDKALSLPEVIAALSDNRAYVVTTADIITQYIESDVATDRGHLFLAL